MHFITEHCRKVFVCRQVCPFDDYGCDTGGAEVFLRTGINQGKPIHFNFPIECRLTYPPPVGFFRSPVYISTGSHRWYCWRLNVRIRKKDLVLFLPGGESCCSYPLVCWQRYLPGRFYALLQKLWWQNCPSVCNPLKFPWTGNSVHYGKLQAGSSL